MTLNNYASTKVTIDYAVNFEEKFIVNNATRFSNILKWCINTSFSYVN